MPVTSPPAQAIPPIAEVNDIARIADVPVRRRSGAPPLPPVQQPCDPPSPSSAPQPLPSITDFNERLLNAQSTKLDDLLHSLHMTKHQAEKLLASTHYKTHQAISSSLIAQQLQVQAQDHVLMCLDRLAQLAHCKNPIIARLATQDLLHYSCLAPPPPQVVPTPPSAVLPALTADEDVGTTAPLTQIGNRQSTIGNAPDSELRTLNSELSRPSRLRRLFGTLSLILATTAATLLATHPHQPDPPAAPPLFSAPALPRASDPFPALQSRSHPPDT